MTSHRFNRMKCSALSKNPDCTTRNGAYTSSCFDKSDLLRSTTLAVGKKTKENVLLAQHDLSVRAGQQIACSAIMDSHSSVFVRQAMCIPEPHVDVPVSIELRSRNV